MKFEELDRKMQDVIVQINCELNNRDIPAANVGGMSVPILKNRPLRDQTEPSCGIAEFRLERRISPTRGRFIFERLR